MQKSILSAVMLGASSLPLLAATNGVGNSACTGPNGILFNREPRSNAIVQVAQSVAFLPGRTGQGNDLLVATASDARGLDTNPNANLTSENGFYVQRSNANCVADFEGGEPPISTSIDTFVVAEEGGSPTVVADPKHDVFFIVDLRLGLTRPINGVGIVRSTAATLLNTTDCPNGTEGTTGTCWPTGTAVDVTDLNTFLFNPHLAVDPRASGTGAGDLYAVVTQENSTNGTTSVFLTSCTNGLNCGNAIRISGSDTQADYSWVQVRPDGGVTISYRNTTFPGINPEQIKFVTCTPNGAPQAPTCNAPILITTEVRPAFDALIGDVNTTNVLYPKHVNRLEADGRTVTTFVEYDRCDVSLVIGIAAVCPKTGVVVTRSSDGGTTWSTVDKVSLAKGQQFFGAISNDDSTGTVNIAYYSTENDPAQQHPQVFLAQILPGATTVGGIHQLTTSFADVQATPPLFFQFQPLAFGNRIGVTAGGNGTSGHSHAYVTYTWNSVPGVYNGVSSPDVINHVALFEY